MLDYTPTHNDNGSMTPSTVKRVDVTANPVAKVTGQARTELLRELSAIANMDRSSSNGLEMR